MDKNNKIEILREIINKSKTFIDFGEVLEPDIIKKYIDYSDDLNSIPKEYITAEILEYYTLKYIMLFDFLFKIPEYILDSSIGKKLIDYFIKMHNNNRKWIQYIPRKYITEDIILSYIENFKNVGFMDEELLTHKVSYVLLKNNLIIELPQGVKVMARKKAKEYEKYQFVMEHDKFGAIKEELILSIDSKLNLEKISSKHQISKKFVVDVLTLIKNEDEKLGLKIKHALEKNNELYLLSIYEDSLKMKKIIKLFGRISGQPGLTKDQKIQFSVLFGNANIQNSITEIYLILKANKTLVDENFSDVFRFLSNFLGYSFYKVSKDFIIPNDDEIYLADYSNDWILTFDEKKYFKMKDGEATITYKFINSDDEVVELTPVLALEIIAILKENEIPTKNCVVKEAFRKHFSGELEEFIENIKTMTRTEKSLILRRN